MAIIAGLQPVCMASVCCWHGTDNGTDKVKT